MRRMVLIGLIFLSLTLPGWATDEFAMEQARKHMVVSQIQNRGVSDPRVLEAMRTVKRHLFVPEESRDQAYEDHPLPIGHQQTISQPYIVAYMTEVLKIEPRHKVLEIGTGSGYQAAILSELADKVYTIEIVKELAEQARITLDTLGYRNVFVRHGDGFRGWPEEAPFDAIIVTAAPEDIPPELVRELKVGGRMIIPVGSFSQELILLTKTPDGVLEKRMLAVRFVPMIKGTEPAP